MRLASIVAISASLATIVAVERVSWAQSAEAEALFNEADAAFVAGNYDQACDAFEGSNRLEPRAGTLIRLGECREKQHRLASAWSAYKDALSRVKDPGKKKIADDRIAAIEPLLSKVTVTISEANRVEGLEILRNGAVMDPALWNRTLPTDGGEIKIVARAPNRKEWKSSIIVATEKGNGTIEIPALELKAAAEPAADTSTPEKPEVDDTEPAEPQGVLTSKRKIAIGLGGVAVAAGVTGFFLWRSAKGLEDDAYALCPDPKVPCTDAARAQDLIDRGSSRSTIATVMLGAALGAGAGAAVLWLIGAPVHGNVAVGIIPRSDGGVAGANLAVKF